MSPPHGRGRKGTNMNTDFSKNSKPIIIGLDHGFGNIKTAHCVFPTGVTRHDTEPTFKNDLLLYGGKYYTIGDGHKEFIADKSLDEDYYILTLAAIAKEMDHRGLPGNSHVILAVGLPLTWASRQRKDFVAYLMKKRDVQFYFNRRNRYITIEHVEVFPQGFAAIAPTIYSFKGLNMLCDIGNGTMNVMYINNCRPVQSKCYTEKYGTHQCTLEVREQMMQQHHVTVDDGVIEEVLRTGTADISPDYLTTIRDAAKDYTEEIMHRLREHEYDSKQMRLYIVGGGGCLVKNFADYDPNRVTINEDICATAKGYEWLAEQKINHAGSVGV